MAGFTRDGGIVTEVILPNLGVDPQSVVCFAVPESRNDLEAVVDGVAAAAALTNFRARGRVARGVRCATDSEVV
jgi:hypothetical protein